MIPINKPKYEKRNMMGGMLENKIKYALVYDKYLERSYVTVCVNVGHYANPKTYDGLAHFLEHMLFMGSKKYPDENHYSMKINEYGGSSNAYTSEMKTVYYFNVFDNGLDEIMDIFSRFFIDPLFKKDSIEREINAVNSEHNKNINNDMRRQSQLLLNLADMKSNINVFPTGSTETLKKDDIRDRLIEFYEKYYVSENISICIVSAKSIEEQMNILNSFSFIPYKKAPEIIINRPLFKDNGNKVYFQKSIRNMYSITYNFEVPEQYYSRTKDFIIFKRIFMNQSKNALTFHLKNMGFIDMIDIDFWNVGIMCITLNLTKHGYDNIIFVNSVVIYCFNNIITMDIEKYAEYYNKIFKIEWNYLNKTDPEFLGQQLTESLFHTDIIEAYENNYMIYEIKTNSEYKKIFKQYIDNIIVIILAQEYSNNTILKYKKNKYYNTEYAEINSFLQKPFLQKPFLQKPFLQKKLDFKWGNVNNMYLAIKPKVINNLNQTIPIYIDNMWYGACSEFKEPIVYVLLQFSNKHYYNTSTNYILTKLCCNILNFLASIILYKPLEFAYNINFVANPSLSNITINIEGFNDIKKIQLIMNEIYNFIDNIKYNFKKLSKDYIDNLIKSYKEDITNINFLPPHIFVSYIIKSSLYKSEYINSILLDTIDNINKDMIEQYIISLFVNTSYMSIVYGNINEPRHILDKFSSSFKSKEFILLPVKKVDNIIIMHPNPKEHSNCITYYYNINNNDIILLILLVSIIQQDFFDILRTKHQLGYIVGLSYTKMKNNYYLVEKVQSEKPIKLVEEKLNNFNGNICDIIKKVDLTKFIEKVKSDLLEKETSISEKFNKYVPEIILQEYQFDRNILLAEKLKNVNINKLISFVEKYINKNNIKKIIIQGNNNIFKT